MLDTKRDRMFWYLESATADVNLSRCFYSWISIQEHFQEYCEYIFDEPEDGGYVGAEPLYFDDASWKMNGFKLSFRIISPVF